MRLPPPLITVNPADPTEGSDPAPRSVTELTFAKPEDVLMDTPEFHDVEHAGSWTIMSPLDEETDDMAD
jgi:hypothetical protein